MIKYALKALTANELSFKVNPMKAPPDAKIEVKPSFSRQIRTPADNPKIQVVSLECKIESTDESPKPFNLLARFVGLFEVENMNTDEDKRIFAINATETLYPYLRAGVSQLTSTALMNPLMLPTIPGSTLFPEDRAEKSYTLNFDPSTLN